jgi:hypothetical protein
MLATMFAQSLSPAIIRSNLLPFPCRICLCLVNIAGQRLVLGLRIINATSEEFTTRRMDLMIDRQMAAFGSVSVSSQRAGGGMWEAVDTELKDMDVLSASKETVVMAAETPQGKSLLMIV